MNAYSYFELSECGTLYSYNDMVGFKSGTLYLWFKYAPGLAGYLKSGSTRKLPAGAHKIQKEVSNV